MGNCGSTRIIQVAGGATETWTRVLDSPNVGDVTFNGSLGSVLIVPKPAVAEALLDADGDTAINTIEGGGANGGDRLEFVVDGTVVGGVEILAGGLTKWDFDGIVDPIVFAYTPITTVERDALTPIEGYTIYNTDSNVVEFYDGSVWQSIGTSVDLNTTVSDETGANGTGVVVPSGALGTPDIGDLHIEIYDDVTLYFTATAADWLTPTVVEIARDITEIGATDSDSGLNLVSNNAGVLADISQDAVKTVVLGAAPVDGTTVAYFVGQLFWDNVNKKLYEATAKSTDPDSAGVGSTFAEVELASANDRLFADDTTVAPTTAGEPTVAEIATFAGANVDTIIYYTGTDLSTDSPTYTYHIDNSGNVTKLNPSVTSERYISIDCYNEPIVSEINTLSETPFINAVLNLSASPGGIGFWQSFTLNSDNITEIEFPISNPIITARTIQPELRVYEGDGVGGTLLHTETKAAFVLAGSESDLPQVFTPNLTGLTSGIYTLQVVNVATTGTPGNFTHYVASGDVYTDGGSSLAATFDMRFRVSSEAGVEEYTVFTYEDNTAYAVKEADNTITDVSGGVPVAWVECPVATASGFDSVLAEGEVLTQHRDLTIGGFEITINDNVGESLAGTTLIGADRVVSNRFSTWQVDYTVDDGTASYVVTSSDGTNRRIIFDATSTIDQTLNILGSRTQIYDILLKNDDVIPRTVSFTSNSVKEDGVTTLPDVILAAGEEKYMVFRGTEVPFQSMWINEYVASSITTTYIDSSVAATDEVLISATGSQAVLFYTNLDVTNTATLSVPVGESLNGVVDAKFTFSNYAKGTQFRVDDLASGEWVVSLVGTPSNSQLSHLLAIRSADIVIDTLDAGDAIPFDTEVSKIGSNISFDPLTGIFTLKAGGTYRLSAELSLTADGGEIEDTYQFYNVNTSSFIGARGHFKDFAGDSSPKPSNPVAVISPTIDTQIILSATGNVDNNTGSLQEHSWMEVMEIPSAEVVLAGMVTPETLNSAAWDRPNGTVNITANTIINYGTITEAWNRTGVIYNGDGTWTLPAGKKYRIEAETKLSGTTGAHQYRIVESSAPTIQLGTTGVLKGINDTTSAASEMPPVYETELLTAPLTIGLVSSSNSAISGLRMSIEEVPTSTVVMPEALAVADINRLYIKRNHNGIAAQIDLGSGSTSDAYVNATPIDFNVGTTLINSGGMIDGSNGQLVAPADGYYKLSGFVTVTDNGGNGTVFRVIIGDTTTEVWSTQQSISSNFAEAIPFHYEQQLSAGDRLDLRVATNTIETGELTAFSVSFEQKPEKSVINTTDTPVNDQATSGYFDVGTMRMAWGKSLGTNNIETVTFAAPFAAPPTVTMSVEDGSVRETRIDNITTTTVLLANGTVNAVKNYIAIGLKPQ